MKYLVIIRHGEFDTGESMLNETGRQQMHALVSILKSLTPLIYSSIGPRAIESAALIAEALETTSEAHEMFGSQTRGEEALTYPTAYEYLKDSTRNVTVVTKGEWADDFIAYFCRRSFDRSIKSVHLERGDCVLINCESGEVSDLAGASTLS